MKPIDWMAFPWMLDMMQQKVGLVDPSDEEQRAFEQQSKVFKRVCQVFGNPTVQTTYQDQANALEAASIFINTHRVAVIGVTVWWTVGKKQLHVKLTAEQATEMQRAIVKCIHSDKSEYFGNDYMEEVKKS